MYQKITVVGRISEPARSESGKMIRFGVAVQETKDGATEWFNGRIINAKMVEALGPILSKGRLVLVEGRQETNDNDGKRYTNLIVDRLRLLDSKDKAESPASSSASAEGSDDSFSHDDIPF